MVYSKFVFIGLLTLSVTFVSCDKSEIQQVDMHAKYVSWLPSFTNSQAFFSEFGDTNYLYRSTVDTILINKPLSNSSITRSVADVTAIFRDSLETMDIAYELKQREIGDGIVDFETICKIKFQTFQSESQIVLRFEENSIFAEEGYFYNGIIWGSDTLVSVLSTKLLLDEGSLLLIDSTGSVIGYRDEANTIYNRL